MNNIDGTNCCSSLEFLGDYKIKSVEVKKGDELIGDAIIGLLIENEEYELRVSMKEGKKEGIGLIVREDGTPFIRMMFVNDECEGEVTKMNEYYGTVLKGRVSKGKEVGIWIEYDDDGNEIWRGLYRNGKRYSILKEEEGMKGFYSEMSVNGDLLNVSEYDDEWRKNGKCFEYEGGRMVRECEYKNGVMIQVLREWKGECMIEYDDNGMRVYEGGFEGDMMKGFVREGRGKEFGIDGKRVLYVGEWKKGLRDGYGSEIKGYCPVYIGEWKNGLRHGTGRELNENGTVMRKGRWIEGVYEDAIKRFEDGYGNDLSVFDIDCLKGIERLEIGNDCLKKVTLFVIDRLNELKSMKIGEKSFSVDKENGKGSKCLIMNCDQLKQIYFGDRSFLLYESFELKNLPSLTTLEMGCASFLKCHLIVFDSMND